jgi:hypothetical protein
MYLRYDTCTIQTLVLNIPLNGKHGLVFDGRRQQSGRAGLRWFERTGGRGRAVAFFCCTSESWRSAVEGKTRAHCDCKT